MAAGGFKFGRASATYDSSTYTTKRAWALDVHRARCDAFFKAQTREGDHWSPCTTGVSGEVSESRTIAGVGSYTLRYIDVHPTTSDTTGAYPAFITIWQDDGSAEYAIITSNGMTRNTSYVSDFTKGLYINSDHLPGYTSNKFSFKSLAHSYANNYFGEYLFVSSDSSIEDEELPIFPICGFSGDTINTSANTANNSASVIYNPTNGTTYYFGYAIRGTIIECFYRTSEFDANSGWYWSIIGEILDSPESGYKTAYFSPSYGNSSNEKTGITTGIYPQYSASVNAGACIDSNGRFFPSTYSNLANTNITTRYSNIIPSYMPCRCNTNSPSDLLFSAGCLAYPANTAQNYAESSNGIDGNGGSVAGLINTDALRLVARQACQVGGAIYQGGNFVVPSAQLGSSNADDFCVILGWDPSNESIV